MHEHRLRSYHRECTGSRPITEVKRGRAVLPHGNTQCCKHSFFLPPLHHHHSVLLLRLCLCLALYSGCLVPCSHIPHRVVLPLSLTDCPCCCCCCSTRRHMCASHLLSCMCHAHIRDACCVRLIRCSPGFGFVALPPVGCRSVVAPDGDLEQD